MIIEIKLIPIFLIKLFFFTRISIDYVLAQSSGKVYSNRCWFIK